MSPEPVHSDPLWFDTEPQVAFVQSRPLKCGHERLVQTGLKFLRLLTEEQAIVVGPAGTGGVGCFAQSKHRKPVHVVHMHPGTHIQDFHAARLDQAVARVVRVLHLFHVLLPRIERSTGHRAGRTDTPSSRAIAIAAKLVVLHQAQMFWPCVSNWPGRVFHKPLGSMPN